MVMYTKMSRPSTYSGSRIVRDLMSSSEEDKEHFEVINFATLAKVLLEPV